MYATTKTRNDDVLLGDNTLEVFVIDSAKRVQMGNLTIIHTGSMLFTNDFQSSQDNIFYSIHDTSIY
jgi:hypothetical protein